jgi:hypothetical protein
VFALGRFEARDSRLCRANPCRDFGLGEAGLNASLENFIEISELFFELVVRLANCRASQSTSAELFEIGPHRVDSANRLRAMAISFGGVFGDFFTK